MKKLLAKIIGATTALAMAIGVCIGISNNVKKAEPVYATVGSDVTIGEGTYTSLYECGFESSESFTASTTYNSTATLGPTSPTSQQWKFYYGTVSTNATITGSQSGHMRWYANASSNYPYAQTEFATSNVKAIKFSYQVSNTNVDFKVQKSSNKSSWTDIDTVNTNATSKQTYFKEFASVEETFYLKILVCLGTAPTSGNYTFRIDDVCFAAEKAGVFTNTSVTLTASENKTILDLNETVQLTAVVKDDAENVVDGAEIAFTSSDTTIATVSNSGLVTASASKYGTTTITASYDGDAEHNASFSTILIRVSDPYVITFVVGDIGTANSWADGDPQSSLGTIGAITINGSGTGNNTKYYVSGNGTWRFYSAGNGQFTVSTSSGYLKKVTLITDSTHYFTSAPNNWSYSNNIFTASNKTQTSVTFSNGSGTSKIEQIEVQIGQAYTVSYDANGGSGTMTDSNSPYDKGSTVTVLDNAFTAPANKVFDHWDTKDDDSGVDYAAGNAFTINANVTLYAQWEDAGSDPYVDYALNSIDDVYSGQTNDIVFSYGNFINALSLLSSDEDVLTISNLNVADQNNCSATLNFVGAGSANLLFKDDVDAAAIKTVPVTVTQTTLSLSKNSTSIRQGEDETLTINTNVPGGGATWTSSNPKITVSSSGVVSVALGAIVGSTGVITATSNVDTNVTATCIVTVTELPTIVTFTPTSTSTASVSGRNPTSSYTFESTFNTNQITSGNSQTLTMTLSRGIKIKTIILSMKSNASKGAGSLIYHVDGSATNHELVANANFNTSGWNGAWSTEYVDVTALSNGTIVANTEFELVLSASANSLYCQSYTIEYDYLPPEVTADTTSFDLPFGDILNTEVKIANFASTPELEYAILSGSTNIDSVVVEDVNALTNTAEVLIQASNTAGVAVIRIRDAANPADYYVDLTINVAETPAQEIERTLTTQTSLAYTDYHDAGGGTFTYDNLGIRFGALVDKDLFDSVNNVTGYGVLVTTKEYLDAQEGVNKLLKNHYDSSNANIDKFDSSATTSGAKITPTQVGNNYKWNVYYSLPSSDVEELTKTYVAVAYIKTSEGVIYLKQNEASAQSLAFDLLDNGTYESDAFGGSLYYMAFAN